MTVSNVTRIELVWPDKGMVPVQNVSGRWQLIDKSGTSTARSIIQKKRIGAGTNPPALSMAFIGSRLDALSAMRRIVGRSFQLVYADIPRIEGFDETRAFLGVEGRTFSIWLSMLREHVRAARQLMLQGGFFVAQAGDTEAPFVRLIMMEAFGRENYIGTAVWRTHYSPKGGKDSNEIAAIHENIICFALDKESVNRVALPVRPEGYSNPDGDPRGEWEARQKDAGRDTVKLKYNMPPYRWTLLGGRLPKGLWRISPMSGVVWGTPEESGLFRFTVKVEDSKGQASEKQVMLKVSKTKAADPAPDKVWWVHSPPKATKANPRIVTDELPSARVGMNYAGVLEASGGSPFVGAPRPGRGWAFGQATLEAAILEDRCSFGKKGTAIPETKKYLNKLQGGMKLINLTSWWDDVAFTQDSTKHQNALHQAGLIALPIQTAKPELLLSRIVDALAPEGALVLELFSRSGDLASVALKGGRPFVSLHGEGRQDREYAMKCAIPRLEAVVTGTELERLSKSEEESSDKREPFLRQQGRLGFQVLEFGPAVASRLRGEEHPRLNHDGFATETELMRAVLTSEGFFVVDTSPNRVSGTSWDGQRDAVIISPRDFIDQATASEFASSRRLGVSLVVYYFRAAEDFTTEHLAAGLSFRRVPTELTT
jgi:hypothetical protein